MPTVLHRLSCWAETDPDSPAQRFKKKSQWETLSARDYMDRVFHLALYLESQGFTEQDVLCIFGYNSPEWAQSELAATLLKGKSAGIYPNSALREIHYILNHSDATFLAVQDKVYFGKIIEEGLVIPQRIKQILVFDGDTSIHPKAVSYPKALAEGKKLAKKAKKPDEYLAKIDPHGPAFLIYTSGTTGNPKGAILSHDNLAFTSDCAVRHWKLPPQPTMFSFLPLCHIAEKLQSTGVGITLRGCVSFASKFENVSTELGEVQPTLLLSVPRLWEKMMEGVQSKVRNATGLKKKMVEWGLTVGARVAEAKYAGRFASPADMAQYPIADRLVLSKVRQALGLGKAKKTASGAAALAPYVSKWFRCLGIEILEDYGQTESTGVICMTEPGVESAGTVGKPVGGMEVKIAEDGEIITRGRHVFKGYYKDEAATAQTLEGGWLHTGDLGEINSRGLVCIRGRKKEILKTSGGKMVAPLPIEERLKEAVMIGQVCIVGDGRKYLSALITLSEETLKALKDRPGVLDGSIVNDSQVQSQVKAHIEELNKTLASYEQIKRFAILPREFSIVDGEMTPTMKMKRNVIEKRYKDIIDSMYPVHV